MVNTEGTTAAHARGTQTDTSELLESHRIESKATSVGSGLAA
jgi:hypothetical protein